MAVISGTAGHNGLRGTAVPDTIYGLAGRDTINPGRGNDFVHAGPGPDVLIWDQDPAARGAVDTYVAGLASEGYDANIYGDLSGGDRLHLNGAGGFRVTFHTTEHGFALDAFGNRLNLAGIERLQTGAGNDWIDGRGAQLNAERGSGWGYTPVHGLTIRSGGGNDTVHGSRGSDVIDPGNGHDRVFGGGGVDLLMPSAGNDYGHAGAGDDNVRWGNNGGMGPIYNIGRDTLSGGNGHDLLNLWAKGNGENSVGVSVTFTSNSAGRAAYPQANGTLVFREFEQFWTHEGRDTVNGAGAAIGADGRGIMINTRWGDDHVIGTRGHDTIEGGAGADTLEGGRGNDFISMFEDATAYDGASVLPDNSRDVLVLRDGSGSDTIRAFQVGDQRDGGGNILRPGDVLNVSDLHDGQGNRVDVGDVRVSSQGGNAVISFPNGERIVLEGVNPAALTPAMLTQMGIPGGASAQRAAGQDLSAQTVASQSDPAPLDAPEAKAVAPVDDDLGPSNGFAEAAADSFVWRAAAALFDQGEITGIPAQAEAADTPYADLPLPEGGIEHLFAMMQSHWD